jgi:uncharacterized membrane protein YecN with MAPEG domain
MNDMSLPITALTASLLAVLLFVLSLRVILFRRKNRISIGDNGDEILAYRVRAQANLAEYAPLGVLLILIAELQGAQPVLLGVLAGAFVLGRLAHGYAFSFAGPKAFNPRVLGMHLTLWPLLGLAAYNTILAITGQF